MNSEKNPGLESHANARGLHVMDTAINAREVSKDLLLNEVIIIPVIGIVKPSFVHLELH